jgi:hypothetical protein
MGRATAADSASPAAKKDQQRTRRHSTPRFKRRSPDSAENYNWLSGQQAPEEEAQVAAVSVLLSFVPYQILKCRERYVENNLYEIQRIIAQESPCRRSIHTRADNAVILQSQFWHLPDSHTNPCILIWHVINANTLAQHVRFVELPSGFDSGPRRVVVFFYNWTVVMEKSS